MEKSRRRSILGLVGSWVAYWAVVGTIKLGPPILAIYRATRTNDPNAASVGVNFANLVLNLTVTDHGRTTYAGSVPLVALALWIAGVPLGLWVAWLYTQRSERTARGGERQRA